jgi:carboxyl-terminal processing protease
MQSGDLITAITRREDDKGRLLDPPEVTSTKGLPLDSVTKRLIGLTRTQVKLTVQRPGVDHPLEFTISRGAIVPETVVGLQRNPDDSWDYFADREKRIGYIRLITFARTTGRDLEAVLKTMTEKGLGGLVLDLRQNTGGFLDTAVAIARLFIDSGSVVTLRGRDRRERPYNAERKGSYVGFPMVCLINDITASGSEIVAACLQDHGRATVMGERSAGVASVQNLYDFDGGQLKVTTDSFWRPSGKGLDKSVTSGKEEEEWGVLPDSAYSFKLPSHEKKELVDHLANSLIIPPRDRPSQKIDTKFHDRVLEGALEYLREKTGTR